MTDLLDLAMGTAKPPVGFVNPTGQQLVNEHILLLPTILDDDLHQRLVAEGWGFPDPWDACRWAEAFYVPSPSHWPDCGCDTRCKACLDARFVVSAAGGVATQMLHHQTGEPLPPDFRRQEQEARQFRLEHRRASPWVVNDWYFDDDKFDDDDLIDGF